MPSQHLTEVTATWTTPLSEDLWKKLEGLKAKASKTGEFLGFGPTLPDDAERRIAEVVVHRHEEQAELHWGLTVRRAPSGEPPEAFKEHAARIGGRAGLSGLLAEGLPSGIPTTGSFRIRLSFPGERFACNVLPAEIVKGRGHDVALGLGRAARLEQVGYRFDAGTGGLEEVALVYGHVENRYIVTASATGPLKLGSPTWLPFADGIVEIIEGAFFSVKEVQS